MDTKFATFNSRLVATITDAFVLSLLSYAINFIIISLHPFSGNTRDLLWIIIINIVIYSILPIIYYPICWIKFDGATIGNKLAAIKIVKIDGTPLTLSTTIVRMIGSLFSGLVLGLGYLWVLWDKRKQGWHDKLAKTYVVKTEAKPNTKLLWLCFLGFILLSILGNISHKNKDDFILINKDGSVFNEKVSNSNVNKDNTIVDKNTIENTIKEIPNTVIAKKISEKEGSIKNGNYIGQAFEFYEKANLNIQIELDYDANVCVMNEVEFFKFQEGNPSKCIYEVIKSPDITTLDTGKYVFVIIPSKEDVHYKFILSASKVE